MTAVRGSRGLRAAALLLCGAGVALLAGCAVGPDFTPPKPDVAARFWPGRMDGGRAAGASVAVPSAVDPAWWTVFQDRELTALEGRLADENLDVATALERLAESRAQVSTAQADQYPSLQADGSYTRELPSKKGVLSLFSGGGSTSFGSQGSVANGSSGTQGAFPNSFSVPAFDLFQYGFDASWELDIWGGVRRGVEAARASEQAAADLARNALVSAEAELARDYVQLRGTQLQLAIVRSDIGTFQRTLTLTKERAAAGLSADLDVANAGAELSSAEAALPSLTARAAQLENAIALLLGREPAALNAELDQAAPVPPVPPRVPVGLPADLLRRRPDIQAAEARLHAATAQIGVAVADFFPQISLTGSFGFQSLSLSQLGSLDAKQYGVGPTITLPIFQGGRLRATLRLRQAQEKEAAVAYRKAVLTALGDVSNALTAYAAEQTRRVRLESAVDQNRNALALSTQRYRQGLSSFIEVLDAERQELQTEQDLASSTTAVSTDLVALFKALGGGWEKAAEQVAAR